MNLVLGVTGGIAAYKAPELVRRLQDAGIDVRVILTPNACRFVSPLSLAAVSGHGVVTEQWGDPATGGVDHIELARWADVLLIAPATANFLAKLSAGIADDALSTYALAHRGPVAVAPAMNTFMLGHPTVTGNLEVLRRRGVRILEPDKGLLACGEEGAGRLPDPPVIVPFVLSLARPADLISRRILVTAGPTREPIDPVRYLTNRSSGRMGYAIAEAAAQRGAFVILVSGPTALPRPANVEFVPVMTASEMYTAVMGRLDGQDVVIKAAAVADFSPSAPSRSKLKKSDSGNVMQLELQKTPDIVEEIGMRSERPLLVAFAAETDAVEHHAREKMVRKRVDFIVANDVSNPSIGFDSEQNEVVVLKADGTRLHLDRAPKLTIANQLLDIIATAFPA